MVCGISILAKLGKGIFFVVVRLREQVPSSNSRLSSEIGHGQMPIAVLCSGLHKGKVQYRNWEQYLNWDCDWDCSVAAALAQLRYHHRLAWTSASRLSADFAQKSIAWLTSRFVNVVVVVVVAPLYTQWKLQQTVLIMPQLHNFNCNASLPMLGKLFYFLVWQTFPLAPFPHHFPFALSLCFFTYFGKCDWTIWPKHICPLQVPRPLAVTLISFTVQSIVFKENRRIPWKYSKATAKAPTAEMKGICYHVSQRSLK